MSAVNLVVSWRSAAGQLEYSRHVGLFSLLLLLLLLLIVVLRRRRRRRRRRRPRPRAVAPTGNIMGHDYHAVDGFL